MSGSPAHDRNSEGLTVAESWQKEALRLDGEADVFTRRASTLRASAARYRKLADEWEREHLGRKWADLQAGDIITLRVFDHQQGWTRERREVVAVEWPVITFRDGSREYDRDCSLGDRIDRDVRLVARRV